jgi:hypothetical protein
LFDVTTGHEIAKLTPTGDSPNDLFGKSVAISGNKALIGAPYDAEVGAKSGAAYLFDATSGQQLGRFTTSEEGAFGQSVAISGNTALVGRSHSVECCGYLGAAYVIDVTSGEELFKLTGSDPGGFSDTFGLSVALSGNTAIVGQSTQNNGAGVADLFDVTTGRKLTTLSASDAAARDFGFALAISGNKAIVGTSTDAAYVFSTVPEPTTSLLILTTAILLALRPRRSRDFRPLYCALCPSFRREPSETSS